MNTTLFLTALALTAPALKDPPKKDVDLSGEWVVETQVTNGRPLMSTIVRRYIFSADGKWTMTTGKNTPALTRTYAINQSKKPATIDMKLNALNDAPNYSGIVKVEGDVMTLCYTRKVGERPENFGSQVGSNHILIVMKRAKKE